MVAIDEKKKSKERLEGLDLEGSLCFNPRHERDRESNTCNTVDDRLVGAEGVLG